MTKFKEINKKTLCIILSVLIVLGASVSVILSAGAIRGRAELKKFLSGYVKGVVSLKNAVGLDREAMRDSRIIAVKNSDGSTTAYGFSEPVTFTDENGKLTVKDTTIAAQDDKTLKAKGYDYANGDNDYRINLSSDIKKNGINTSFGGSSLTLVPNGQADKSGSKRTAAKSASSKIVPPSLSISPQFISASAGIHEPECEINSETMTYDGVYGEDTVLIVEPQPSGVNQKVILNEINDINDISFNINTDKNTASFDDKGNIVISDTDDEIVQKLYVPIITIEDKEKGTESARIAGYGSYSLTENENGTYTVSASADSEQLNLSSYNPQSENLAVTLAAAASSGKISPYLDTGIYTKKPDSCYNAEITACFGLDSGYGYGRVLTHFLMPDSIKKGAVINSAYFWTRETTGETSTTYVQPYVVNDVWNSKTTWNTRPYYMASSTMSKRCINSKSSDVSDNPYWYKFNISQAVKLWAAGTKNDRGLMFKSSEETDKNYSWRAFATKEYPTASMRPYTVISYTNDTVAPTVTSVTGNPSEWTKNDVTLTVNGASDSGAGLASAPYSFSTTKGTYVWQSGNSKTFSSNGTVYVYVRDALNNIALVKTVNISKIDKTAPSVSAVSGNSTSLTKSVKLSINGASDSQSGLAAEPYSFSNAENVYNWSAEKTKTFTENQTVYAYVRDAAGNIKLADTVVIDKIMNSEQQTALPCFYQDGHFIGIVKPSETAEIEYKIGENGEWTAYSAPFTIPAFSETTVYSRIKGSSEIVSETFTSDNYSDNAYTESNADFTLSYKTAAFEFIRTYDVLNGKWVYATDSSVRMTDNSNLIEVLMPDAQTMPFRKVSQNSYINDLSEYTLTVNSESQDARYSVSADGIVLNYFADGLLSSVNSKYEDTITISRTENAVTVSDGAGRSYVIALNENGAVSTVTDPANGTINYSYDENGNLIKVTDQAGVVIASYEYASGRISKSMDKSVVYDSHGRVSRFVYNSGAYENITYDDETNTVTTSTSSDTSSSVTFNDAYLIVSSTDENGSVIEYTYNDKYLVTSETTDGSTISYTYDSAGNMLSSSGEGNTAEYVYNDRNQLVREHSGDTYTYYTYNNMGEISVQATLKENYTGEIPAEYSEDLTCFDTVKYTLSGGFVIKSEDSEKNEVSTYAFDAYGNNVTYTLTKTEEDGTVTVGTTDSTYDVLGNLLTVASADEKSSYVYDAAGRTLLSDENGECSRTIYDSFGRTVQQIEPEDYDASKDGLKAETPSNTYSDSSAGHTYVYNADGTLASETNRLGVTTTYTYNPATGTKETEAFDLYEYTYLPHGEIDGVDIADADSVDYEYDDNYNVIKETYANGDVIRYTYDADENLTAQYHNSDTDPYVTYTYDESGELTQKVNSESGLKYVYDADGNVKVYRLSDNTLIHSYTETETENGEDDPSISVEQDNFGTQGTSVSSGNTTTFTEGENTVEYSCTTNEEDEITADSLKQNKQDVYSSQYQYDDDGNVTQKSIVINEKNAPVTYQLGNTYDGESKILSESFAGRVSTYTYDANDQLTRVNNELSGYTSKYTYDARGNILSRSYYNYTTGETGEAVSTDTFTYQDSGWKDRLVKVNNDTLTYDENGNVLTFGTKTYLWNGGRQLAGITDGEKSYSYTYDEDGIRTGKTVNGKTTSFNTKDGAVLSQTDGTDTLVFQYDGDGMPIGFTLNGTQYYYITDISGNVIAITDENREFVAEYYYDEWGRVLITEASGAENKKAANLNPLRYRGYYYDTETGYYYLQSRYYNPEICRFINADVYTDTGTGTIYAFNMFAYCENDPVNCDDPTGEKLVLSENRSRFFKSLQALSSDTLKYKKDGTVYIKKKADKLTKYYGTTLIRWIIRNVRTVRICIDHFYGATVYVPDIEKNAYHPNKNKNQPGEGTGGKIHINKKDEKKRPLRIILAHELIHAYRAMWGISIKPKYRSTIKYSVKKGGKIKTQNIEKEEAFTIGLYNANADKSFRYLIISFTENAIRKEQKLPKRTYYD